MKKVKKANIKIITKTYETHSIQCPHCKTFLEGTINSSTIRFKCWNCKNPIEIIWPEDEN
jgi:DNA-directed RNA polymerase subunit RPC12/RpoP